MYLLMMYLSFFFWNQIAHIFNQVSTKLRINKSQRINVRLFLLRIFYNVNISLKNKWRRKNISYNAHVLFSRKRLIFEFPFFSSSPHSIIVFIEYLFYFCIWNVVILYIYLSVLCLSKLYTYAEMMFLRICIHIDEEAKNINGENLLSCRSSMNVLLLLLVFFMLDRDIKYRKENERKQNYVFYISLAIFFCSF